MVLRRKSKLDLRATKDAFPYQLEATEFLKDLDYAGVFHEQGLGKTKIGIDLALHWLSNDIVDSVIIVTKKSLISNWQREIKGHTRLSARILGIDRLKNYHAFHKPTAIFLAHYEAILAEEERIEIFSGLRRLGTILDESHKIKNPDARVSSAFHRLGPKFVKRVVMTGSPIANRPYDLWSQVYFLDQGEALGKNFREFKRQLDIPRGGHGCQDQTAMTTDSATPLATEELFETRLAALAEQIQSFTVRETKDGAGIELPGKHYEQVPVRWEEKQYETYCKIRDELRVEILRDGVPIMDSSDELLKRMLRLVQICSNPGLIDERYSNTPGKVPVLLEKVEKISRRSEKVIVWTCFVDNVSWLSNLLGKYSPAIVHGRMSMEQRDRSIERFLTHENVQVLIATPQSSKEGLTLTAANHVIFYDRSFSLDDYIQAQDRIHRISQTKTCFIYNLIMTDSIEGWVNSLLATKQAAASLGQNDIDLEEFQSRMRYDLGSELRTLLNMD
jgi:SNF2 family DNA or RNA helicase